eukprot:536377-Pelagomonas_calceolata.AAC.1
MPTEAEGCRGINSLWQCQGMLRDAKGSREMPRDQQPLAMPRDAKRCRGSTVSGNAKGSRGMPRDQQPLAMPRDAQFWNPGKKRGLTKSVCKPPIADAVCTT